MRNERCGRGVGSEGIIADHDVEIGIVREDELESLLALLCAAFELPFEAARDVFYADPYFDRNNKLVLRVDGRIVSCLTIVPQVWRIRRTKTSVAGIAGLATWPEERGKGYATRLLGAALFSLTERGFEWVALVPAAPKWYLKRGWEMMDRVNRLTLLPNTLPVSGEARHVHPAATDEIPILQSLHQRAARKWLICERDEARWRYLLRFMANSVVYAEPNQPVTGYAFYDFRPPPPIEWEIAGGGATLTPVLNVLEIIAETDAAWQGLLGHLATYTPVWSVVFTLSEAQASLGFMADWLRERKNAHKGPSGITHEIMCNVLGRKLKADAQLPGPNAFLSPPDYF